MKRPGEERTRSKKRHLGFPGAGGRGLGHTIGIEMRSMFVYRVKPQNQ